MLPEPETHLAAADPKLGKAIDAVIAEFGGPQKLESASTVATHFEALARNIVYQQLSGKAAAAIYGKVCAGLGGRITPESLSKSSAEQLRTMGLSNAKSRYLMGMSSSVLSGKVSFDRLDQMSDEEVIETLTSLSGVGLWTAQMFLMFRLARPDVLSGGDLGLRKGCALVHGMKETLASPEELLRLGKRWSPWRSVASLYLWRAVDIKYEVA